MPVKLLGGQDCGDLGELEKFGQKDEAMKQMEDLQEHLLSFLLGTVSAQFMMASL